MQTTATVTARSIAFLATFCKDHGLPTTQHVSVPETGMTARAIAEKIGLPVERIQGVFHNYSTAGLDAVALPGDRVAFVPYGTPAPHPAFFGAFVTRR